MFLLFAFCFSVIDLAQLTEEDLRRIEEEWEKDDEIEEEDLPPWRKKPKRTQIPNFNPGEEMTPEVLALAFVR